MSDLIIKVGTISDYVSARVVINPAGLAPCFMENHGEVTRILIEYEI